MFVLGVEVSIVELDGLGKNVSDCEMLLALESDDLALYRPAKVRGGFHLKKINVGQPSAMTVHHCLSIA